MLSRLLHLGCALALVACASVPEPVDRANPSLVALSFSDHRSEAHRARDQYRHPVQTLQFFGLRPDMTVVELWPGASGWYTEFLAPYLREDGKLYAASFGANYEGEFADFLRRAHLEFEEKLAAAPHLYDRVTVTRLNPPHATEIAPAGSADMVLTFRNLHNWLAWDLADETLAAIHRALKPGGILGVTDHRAPDGAPVDPKAKNGYVNEDFAIRTIEAAGFELIGKSEINANDRDLADYPQGVWTLPPTLRLGAQDREKYLAIGESDRFTLKFIKR